MGFTKYQTTQSTFDKYYDIFLHNGFLGRRFRVILTNGDSAEGVPLAGSIANPFDPEVSFFFRMDDGNTYLIPFRALQEAIPLQR